MTYCPANSKCQRCSKFYMVHPTNYKNTKLLYKHYNLLSITNNLETINN